MKENFWKDGVCKDCESVVEEGSSSERGSDYMNRCTNVDCKNHCWHHIGDDEFLDYYKHKGD